ncbi:hypothetical protein NQ317_001796 [Molorchus minor]|uniref:RNase H type-1 domain-containing protein n=1 Tax=Molorchus minor TaxID=1323400 RepID=A0ABQ9J1D6_9CUCU|nr:hypothetical protein NQ317_001796 [Molorchus minor]
MKAALQAICVPRTKCALVQERRDALRQLARQKEVTLVWWSGHTEVPGNERADELAQSRNMGPCQGLEPFIEISRRYVNKTN